MPQSKPHLCIVGLGYVGLPLAHAFAKNGYAVSGYDVSEERIATLKAGHDYTNELTDEQLQEMEMEYSTDASLISQADVVIVAVPTPIDDQKKPDITILKAASQTVGQHLKAGSIVVFESTVYPGTTEDICGPIIEQESGLQSGTDFTLGYSPERINPGDKEHTVEKIVKVVAGQDAATADALCDLYGSIITAGVHRAPNIKVAEMAKAIENAQRDLNIAFVNEVAQLCGKVGIRSQDVLAAAGTKWNFLPFAPGLVGGHCIGVDPYYLVEKAKQLGMETQVITAGRSVNDSMGQYVAEQIVTTLGDKTAGARVLVLGLTFKENVPDTRNSKVGDVINALTDQGCTVQVHDPFYAADQISAMGWQPGTLDDGPFDVIACLVPHREFLELGTPALLAATAADGIVYDLKSMLDAEAVQAADRTYLSL